MRFVSIPIVIALVAATPACTARVQPATVTAETVEYEYVAPPPDIESRPYVVYEGAPTYYVEGRWYRRTPRGWGYYRSEPAPLVRQRPYVQQAPPAYRRGPQQAPPAYRRGPQEAPPAYRR